MNSRTGNPEKPVNILPQHVVSTVVFITRNDALLLVRQDYGQRYWSLPGGVVENGESVEEAAIREVKEETNLDIRVERVIAIYSKPEDGSIAISVEGIVIGGELQAAHEISECGFFPMDQLPQPVRSHIYQRIRDFQKKPGYSVLRKQ